MVISSLIDFKVVNVGLSPSSGMCRDPVLFLKAGDRIVQTGNGIISPNLPWIKEIILQNIAKRSPSQFQLDWT